MAIGWLYLVEYKIKLIEAYKNIRDTKTFLFKVTSKLSLYKK